MSIEFAGTDALYTFSCEKIWIYTYVLLKESLDYKYKNIKTELPSQQITSRYVKLK